VHLVGLYYKNELQILMRSTHISSLITLLNTGRIQTNGTIGF